MIGQEPGCGQRGQRQQPGPGAGEADQPGGGHDGRQDQGEELHLRHVRDQHH